MSLWRLLGECAQAMTREDLRAQSIDGWNPWQNPWVSLRETVVIPDRRNSCRQRHIDTYEVAHAGKTMRFAADQIEDVWYFYVPASTEIEGAFEAAAPQYEGFWRDFHEEESTLPWPQPDEEWAGREEFLHCLAQAEAIAERIMYRGYSLCRICSTMNGSESLRLAAWEWPSGYRHYVAAHFIRPSTAFELFVLGCKVHSGS